MAAKSFNKPNKRACVDMIYPVDTGFLILQLILHTYMNTFCEFMTFSGLTFSHEKFNIPRSGTQKLSPPFVDDYLCDWF